MFVHEAGKGDVGGELELLDELLGFGIMGVGASGDHEVERQLVFGEEDVEGLDQAGEVFVAAVDAGVEQEGLGDFVVFESFVDGGLVGEEGELGRDAIVDGGDFLGVGTEVGDDVLFGVVGNGDYVAGSADGVADSEVVGQAVIPLGHFVAGEESKNKIVNGHNVGPAIEQWHIKMREMNDVAIGLAEVLEEMSLLFERIVGSIY